MNDARLERILSGQSAFLVEKLYRRITGRVPDEGQISEYLHRLLIDGESLRDVAYSIAQAEPQTGTPLVLDSPAPLQAAQPDISIAGMPALTPPGKQEYAASELLCFEGDLFVQGAYSAILHRAAGPDELESSRMRLITGEISRHGLLVDLLDSEEGRRTGVRVAGLKAERRRRKLISLPVVGRLLHSLVLFLNLPNVERDLRGLRYQALESQLRLNLAQAETADLTASFERLYGRVSDIELMEEFLMDNSTRLDDRIDSALRAFEAD